MTVRELLVEPLVHLPPAKALEGLTPEDAGRRPTGSPHSIVELVAHMDFWLTWFCARCEGVSAPMPAHAAEGWPVVAAKDWPDVETRFTASLERAVAIGEDSQKFGRPITPAIEFPPLAEYTVRDAMVHAAGHNAHHLGQVILLRQMMGLWPPPAGSWTW
jgi:uncharacterized damage-inducible protein DinB